MRRDRPRTRTHTRTSLGHIQDFLLFPALRGCPPLRSLLVILRCAPSSRAKVQLHPFGPSTPQSVPVVASLSLKTFSFSFLGMKFDQRAGELRAFVSKHNRFPKQTAPPASEKTLASWIKYFKKRARGVRSPELTAHEIKMLEKIPGWTFQRWKRDGI